MKPPRESNYSRKKRREKEKGINNGNVWGVDGGVWS